MEADPEQEPTPPNMRKQIEQMMRALSGGDVTKVNAIEHLLDYLSKDVKDTFAFGDAKIDIPMLEYCNVGVAVNSGGDEIKAMADYITDDVDKDGLYNAFKHFGLI